MRLVLRSVVNFTLVRVKAPPLLASIRPLFRLAVRSRSPALRMATLGAVVEPVTGENSTALVTSVLRSMVEAEVTFRLSAERRVLLL